MRMGHAAPMTTQMLREFDPQVAATLDDPYQLYAELRHQGAIARVNPGGWAVMKHAEVSALLRDERLGHRFPRNYIEFVTGPGPLADLQEDFLLNHDPPTHTRLRNLMARASRGIDMRQLADHITHLAAVLINRPMCSRASDVRVARAYPRSV